MKLIIDIDENVLEAIKSDNSKVCCTENIIMIEAIKNGTPYNPSGDCISRSDLRKEVTEKVNFTTVDGHIAYDKMLKLIDNAQAVPQVVVFTESTDEKAVADLKAELQSVIETRPKGEWKCTVHSTYRGYYKDGKPVWGESKVYTCPVCGRSTVVKENFCPSCGTDMRGIPLSERIRKFKQEDLEREVTG